MTDKHNKVSLFDKEPDLSIARKPVFGASNQVRHILGCTATEDGIRLDI